MTIGDTQSCDITTAPTRQPYQPTRQLYRAATVRERSLLAITLAALLTACHHDDHRGIMHSLPGEPQAANFTIQSRTAQMNRYPCSRCHDKPIVRNGQKNAHWEITVRHAPENVMTCATCHGDGAMDTLKGSIALDASHELCAQCHSTQAKDWRAGAHGKRLSGWAEPRVIANCAACHNPHKPKLEARWPAIAK